MPESVNKETHHEKSDVSVRALLWFVVIFIAFAIVTHVVLYGLYQGLRWEFRNEAHPPRTAMRLPPDAAIPQTPRLQPFKAKDAQGNDMAPNASTPVVDMAEMHAQEQEALDKPGWIDQQKGKVRIPIDRAKQLVLERGLLQVNTTTGGAQ